MPEPVETWSGEVRLRREVRVQEYLDLPPVSTFTGPRSRRYRVHQVDINTSWTPGAEGTLEHFVVLQVHEVIGGHVLTHRDGTLYLDQLQKVPDWLASIVERGTIRCQCRHLGSAHGGEEPAEVVTDGCAIHLVDLLPPPPPGPPGVDAF